MVHPFKNKCVLMAICSDAGSNVFLVDESEDAGSPLMDVLALEPKFVDRCGVSDGTSVVTGDCVFSYV